MASAVAEASCLIDLVLLLNNLALPFNNLAFRERNMALRNDNMAQLTINLALTSDYLALDTICRLLQRQKQTIKQIKKHFISTEMFFT